MASSLSPEELNNWVNALSLVYENEQDTNELDQVISGHINAGHDWSPVAELLAKRCDSTAERFMNDCIQDAIRRVLHAKDPIREEIDYSNFYAAGIYPMIRIPIAPSSPSNSKPFDPKITLAPLTFDETVIKSLLDTMNHMSNFDIPQSISSLENPQAISISVHTLSSATDLHNGLDNYKNFRAKNRSNVVAAYVKYGRSQIMIRPGAIKIVTNLRIISHAKACRMQ